MSQKLGGKLILRRLITEVDKLGQNTNNELTILLNSFSEHTLTNVGFGWQILLVYGGKCRSQTQIEGSGVNNSSQRRNGKGGQGHASSRHPVRCTKSLYNPLTLQIYRSFHVFYQKVLPSNLLNNMLPKFKCL